MSETTTRLPSISHLLTIPPSPLPSCSSPSLRLPSSTCSSVPSAMSPCSLLPLSPLPSMNLPPPSPVPTSLSSSPGTPMHTSPRHCPPPSFSNYMSPPLLSPTESVCSRSPCFLLQPPSPLPPPALSLPPVHPLTSSCDDAPLQGYDPPRPLVRLPTQGISTANLFNKLPTWTSFPIPSPSSSHSTLDSFDTTMSEPAKPPSPSPVRSPARPPPQRPPSSSPPSQPVSSPPTQILFDKEGKPILKRRRGRPATIREPTYEGGWTFLAPTVWDVVNAYPASHSQGQPTPTSQVDLSPSDGGMDDSMAAFTDSNMDIVLQMPKKKRGRKPKTHIAGNSCFIWRELTVTRTVKRKKSDPLPNKRSKKLSDHENLGNQRDNDDDDEDDVNQDEVAPTRRRSNLAS